MGHPGRLGTRRAAGGGGGGQAGAGGAPGGSRPQAHTRAADHTFSVRVGTGRHYPLHTCATFTAPSLHHSLSPTDNTPGVTPPPFPPSGSYTSKSSYPLSTLLPVRSADVAVALSRRSRLDPEASLAALAAAGRWEEVVEELQQEAARALHAPHPPARCETYRAKPPIIIRV